MNLCSLNQATIDIENITISEIVLLRSAAIARHRHVGLTTAVFL